MKIEIIKAEMQEYKTGDIISLGNPFGTKAFQLVEHINKAYVGAVDLQSGIVEYQSAYEEGLESLVDIILKDTDSDEWRLIPNNNVGITLNCRG